MSAAQDSAGGRIAKMQPQNNVYTALLGLTTLVLAVSVAYVCWRSMDMFDTIFGVVTP